ncbi:MAG: matrixin family metalloprotease [Chryseolinea sp.]
MKKIYFVLLVMSITLSVVSFSYGQSRQPRYDDYPITVPSNAKAFENFEPGKPSQNYNLIGTVWNHRVITYFFQNGTADLAGNTETQAIRDAFAIWSAQTSLAFLEVCTAGAADIVIAWGTFNHGDPSPLCFGNPGPFDGANGVLAHNMGGPDPNTCGTQGGDVHFDDSETWTLNLRGNGAQPIDLVTVAAHEIGHGLGLFHTSVAGSLMLANYTGSHRFLATDDILGVRAMYGMPTAGAVIAGPSMLCTTNANYSVAVPAGTAVTWTATPAALFTPNSGTGATATLRATSTNTSTGTITFTMNSGCGNATTTSRTINLNLQQVRMPTTTYYGPGANIYAEIDWIPDATSYEWFLDGTFQQVSSYNHEFTFYGCGNHYTSVRVNTPACGWTEQTYIWWTSVCGGFFAVYPNPAENFVKVEISEDLNKIAEPPSSPRPSLKNESFAIELFDGTQNVVRKIKSTDGQALIDTRDLKPGTYYLNILYKGGTSQHKIEVKPK